MGLNNGETIEQDIARIDWALAELARRDLPEVWVGEPEKYKNGNLRGPKVEWSRLSEMKQEVRDSLLLPPRVEQELFEESMYVVAAKQGLVTVRKLWPVHELTYKEQRAIELFKENPAVPRDHERWGMSPNGSWPRAEDWVREDTQGLFQLPPNENFPGGSAYLVGFVARDELTPAHLPCIQGFLQQAKKRLPRYSVPATDEVMFALDAVRGLEQI